PPRRRLWEGRDGEGDGGGRACHGRCSTGPADAAGRGGGTRGDRPDHGGGGSRIRGAAHSVRTRGPFHLSAGGGGRIPEAVLGHGQAQQASGQGGRHRP